MTREGLLRLGYPNLGLGVGLRSGHFSYLEQNEPDVDWFEVIPENFMDSSGRPRQILNRIAARYPVVLHCLSLSIGSTDPIDFEYLGRVQALSSELDAAWISDHVCWSAFGDVNTHELVPVPFTEQSLTHIVQRIRSVQSYLQRPLVLENLSSYVSFTESTLSEAEFLARMAEDADCGLLLDVNNVYVSSVNHGFDPVEYVNLLPARRIVQIHLAGHNDVGTHIIDSHDRPVADEVWDLYRTVVELIGPVSTLIEWDERLPAFPEVHAEVLKARRFLETANV